LALEPTGGKIGKISESPFLNQPNESHGRKKGPFKRAVGEMDEVSVRRKKPTADQPWAPLFRNSLHLGKERPRDQGGITKETYPLRKKKGKKGSASIRGEDVNTFRAKKLFSWERTAEGAGANPQPSKEKSEEIRLPGEHAASLRKKRE